MTSCDHAREELSADLDGEADAGSAREAYQHLDACPACARWFASVTRVNRLVRTAPADPGPGLSDARLAELLGELPRRSVSRPGVSRGASWRRLARVALAVVGLAQVGLGVWPLCAPIAAAMDVHTEIWGAGMVHMSHEYSAWSVALGIAFLVGARWTRHLAGALPLLASFVAVLALVSTIDLVAGDVDLARVLSHLLVVLGLALVVVIVVTGSPEHHGRSQAASARRDHDPDTEAVEPDRLPGSGGPAPAAFHRAA